MAEVYQPFALEKLRGCLCSCGAPTIAEHEFCFCSPKCAREDSLRALGTSESHYRTVFKRACIPPQPSLRRLASSRVLRPDPTSQPGWEAKLKASKPVIPEPRRNNVTLGTLPTLEQVTDAVMAKKAKNGGHYGSDRDRSRWGGLGTIDAQRGDARQTAAYQGRSYGNIHMPPAQISLYAIPMPQDVPSRPPLREQPSTTGMKNATHQRSAQFSDKGKAKARENAVEFGFQQHTEAAKGHRKFEHTVHPGYAPPSHSKPFPPRPLPQVPPVIRPLPPIPTTNPVVPTPTEMRRSQTLRRSASFAGWDIPTGRSPISGDEALRRAFDEVRAELRAVGDEDFDPRDYFRDDEDDDHTD